MNLIETVAPTHPRADTDTLRTLVVGSNGVGRVHLEALSRVNHAHVAGFTTLDPTDAARLSAAFPDARASTDALHEIASDRYDVVHICTPNDTHAALGAAVLESAKYLVMEKPVAGTVPDALTLARTARRLGAVVPLCYKYRHEELLQRLRRTLQSGDVGTPTAVRAKYLQSWGLTSTATGWRAHPTRVGFSPVLLDIGVHILDLVEHVLGRELTDPTGATSTSAPIDTLLFDAHGLPVCLSVSQLSGAHDNYLEIEIDTDLGTTLRWSLDGRESLTLTRQAAGTEFRTDRGRQDRELSSQRNLREPGPTDSVVAMLNQFYEYFAAHRAGANTIDPGFATIEDGYRHILTLSGVRRPEDREPRR